MHLPLLQVRLRDLLSSPEVMVNDIACDQAFDSGSDKSVSLSRLNVLKIHNDKRLVVKFYLQSFTKFTCIIHLIYLS